MDTFEKVINLCDRRGIAFPSVEIYNAQAGFFDYGPPGVAIRARIEDSWRNAFVSSQENVVEMDGSLVSPLALWKASGHLAEFNDPLVQCEKCKTQYRADQLLEKIGLEVDGKSAQEFDALIEKHAVKCEKCKGKLAAARSFNLMFKTIVGPVEDEKNTAYLRPETAQLIFANFKKILLTQRCKLPFGIAQVGKAFRNEIAPRNFLFRSREFTQLELEYFFNPAKDEAHIPDHYAIMKTQVAGSPGVEEFSALASKIKSRSQALWIARTLHWMYALGIRAENLRLRKHTDEELSHYSQETWDVEYHFSWGWKEIAGIAHRGNYDLTQHAKAANVKLEYFDPDTKQSLVPSVIEPSIGLDRVFLAVLCDAYSEKGEGEDAKVILKLSPKLSPQVACVFPLVNKDGVWEYARDAYEKLKAQVPLVSFDDAGSIGKRYARADELGISYCITVDYDSLKDGTVTLRERDSGAQQRVPLASLAAVLSSLNK